MAVWFTTERAKVGPVFGFIDKFEGLGIFFDTYPNARHTVSSWLKKRDSNSIYSRILTPEHLIISIHFLM